MRPAVRLAAIQQAPVTFVWTHDSIGLGEDGPTHQPVEHLAALRAIPGFDVVRPADANETAAAWLAILRDTPTGRPGAVAARTCRSSTVRRRRAPARSSGVAKGGYVLSDASKATPDVILVATGSEVQLAVDARETLEKSGIATRVVSMPCREWFDAQTPAYRRRSCPPRSRPASASRPASPRAGATSSATPARSSGSSTSAPPPTTRPSSASSDSPPAAVVAAAKKSLKTVKGK